MKTKNLNDIPDYIYLSIGKTNIKNVKRYIKAIREKYQYDPYPIIRHNDASVYNLEKLTNSKIVFIAIPDDFIIGKGVYQEITMAWQRKKEVLFIHSGLIYNNAEIKIINHNDWIEYAKLIIYQDTMLKNTNSKRLNKKLLLLP